LNTVGGGEGKADCLFALLLFITDEQERIPTSFSPTERYRQKERHVHRHVHRETNKNTKRENQASSHSPYKAERMQGWVGMVGERES